MSKLIKYLKELDKWVIKNSRGLEGLRSCYYQDFKNILWDSMLNNLSEKEIIKKLDEMKKKFI